MMHEWVRSWAWSSGSPVAAVLVTAAIWLFCFIPSGIAVWRGHRSAPAIIALNLLLGWTGLGWIAAFIWSLSWPGPDETARPFHRGHPL
jgi:hypothetical protein